MRLLFSPEMYFKITKLFDYLHNHSILIKDNFVWKLSNGFKITALSNVVVGVHHTCPLLFGKQFSKRCSINIHMHLTPFSVSGSIAKLYVKCSNVMVNYVSMDNTNQHYLISIFQLHKYMGNARSAILGNSSRYVHTAHQSSRSYHVYLTTCALFSKMSIFMSPISKFVFAIARQYNPSPAQQLKQKQDLGVNSHDDQRVKVVCMLLVIRDRIYHTIQSSLY